MEQVLAMFLQLHHHCLVFGRRWYLCEARQQWPQSYGRDERDEGGRDLDPRQHLERGMPNRPHMSEVRKSAEQDECNETPEDPSMLDLWTSAQISYNDDWD